MPAIDFPNSPVLNQEFTAGTAIYIWDGVAWRIKSSAIPAISSIVSYADEAPINPVAGQIWVESDVDVITYNPQIVTRWSKVLTESESVFDDYSPTGTFLQYTVGYESVYLNGVLLLRGTDYTATDGLIVTLTTAAQAGDVIEIISPNNYINVNTYTVSEVDSQLSLKANLASPAFTGTVDFSSATVTGIDLLPSQTGNSGKYLTTNGTTAAWSNTITANSTSTVAIIAKGVASQTANLQEWQNSSSTVVASISNTGAFTAVTKSFDIDHPTKEGMRLRYGSLEGPENGVYVRGVSSSSVITLPDYWVGLVHKDSLTVQLTAKGKPQPLCVEEIVDNKVIVGGVEGEFFYFIQAERKDIDRLVVEY